MRSPRRVSVGAALVLALAAAAPLHAQIRRCASPTGYSGPLRDFNPAGTLGAAVDEFRDCVAARGREVEADPFSGVIEQYRLDENANFVLRVGRQVVGWLPYADVLDAVEYTHSANELSPEIREGIRARFDAFAAGYERARHRPQGATGASLEEARSLLAEWTALKGALEQSLPMIKDPKTAELVRQKLAAGDGLAWSILLDAVQGSAMTPAQVRQALADAGLGTDERVLEQIRTRVERMAADATARAAAVDSAHRAAAESAERIQRIGDYATLTHSLLGVASYAGILSPRDATTMQGVVGGAAQIATAAAMLHAGTYAAAGPYGMAIGGGLMIASALQRPGASGTQQLADMLRQISKQIADLQRSVDLGFEGLSIQLNQSERRIMERLSVVIRQNDLLALRTEQLRGDVLSIRQQIADLAEANRVQENMRFVRRIPYYDGQCLRSFRFWQAGDRAKCLAAYSELTRDFATAANASLVGRANRVLVTSASADDQMAALLAEGALLTGQGSPQDAVHGPTLALLEDRVRLFVADNPGVRSRPEAVTMFRQLDTLRARYDAGVAALTAGKTREAARAAWSAELDRLVRQFDARSAAFADTAIVTETDERHVAEVRAQHNPSALASQAQWFAASGPALAGRIGFPPNPEQLLGTKDEGYGPHVIIRDKLTNYARALQMKDSASILVAPEQLRGFYWVGPCNAQSEWIPFPVRREVLGTALGREVAALTAAGRGMLSICYNPSVVRRDGDNVGIGNTNTGIDVVWNRLAARGMSNRMAFCYQQAVPWFNAVYMAYAEYTGSAWEKCHHGHLHHVLTTRARQITGVSFQATLDLPGYRSATKTVTASRGYTNAQLDLCLLPVTLQGAWHPAAVFDPYLQQFPLDIQQACPGVDAQFVWALPELRGQLTAFLDSSGTTRRVGDPASPEVSYRVALREVLAARRDANYRAYLDAIMGPGASFETLDRLHAFQLAIDALARPTVVQTAGTVPRADAGIPAHMSGADLRSYLATMLRDPVTGALATVRQVIPTSTAAPPVTAPLSPPKMRMR